MVPAAVFVIVEIIFVVANEVGIINFTEYAKVNVPPVTLKLHREDAAVVVTENEPAREPEPTPEDVETAVAPVPIDIDVEPTFALDSVVPAGPAPSKSVATTTVTTILC
jgi:hypothetical protein